MFCGYSISQACLIMKTTESIKPVSNMEKCSIIKNMAEHKPILVVVDDELDQCESIKSYFSKRNFLVFTAATGKEALALIKENKPDLVLLDMKLSESMDGKDVLGILREHDKHTKVAFVTGDILSEEKIKEITDLGIVEFLTKPVELEELEGIVKKVLKDSYPKRIRFEAIKPKKDAMEISLRRIAHDLSNVASDIANKCELYVLDTEEGLKKDKTEKERLNEAINILKSVLKQTARLTEILEKLSSLAKKEL